MCNGEHGEQCTALRHCGHCGQCGQRHNAPIGSHCNAPIVGAPTRILLLKVIDYSRSKASWPVARSDSPDLRQARSGFGANRMRKEKREHTSWHTIPASGWNEPMKIRDSIHKDAILLRLSNNQDLLTTVSASGAPTIGACMAGHGCAHCYGDVGNTGHREAMHGDAPMASQYATGTHPGNTGTLPATAEPCATTCSGWRTCPQIITTRIYHQPIRTALGYANQSPFAQAATSVSCGTIRLPDRNIAPPAAVPDQ